MAMTIPYSNDNTGAITNGYEGLSWTVLFFGPCPALFRNHWAGFIGMLLLALLSFGISHLFFIFLYNKWHRNWLASNGFHPQYASAFTNQ